MPKVLHGESWSPAFVSWLSMRQRCYDENRNNFKDYGGRGIRVCDRWRHSFKNFLEDMGPRPQGTTLDRIKVNGHYEPGNCRWAAPSLQTGNRRQRAAFTARRAVVSAAAMGVLSFGS